jgi:hypothetical protein
VGVSAEGVGRGYDGTGSVFMCEGVANVLFCVEICLIVSLQYTYTGTPRETP